MNTDTTNELNNKQPASDDNVLQFQAARWSSGIGQDDLEREGSTLLALLYAKAQADGLQAQELATEKLGVHPSYLGQLRSRVKSVENISHEFAEACARYLGIPLIAVLVAAGQLK